MHTNIACYEGALVVVNCFEDVRVDAIKSLDVGVDGGAEGNHSEFGAA